MNNEYINNEQQSVYISNKYKPLNVIHFLNQRIIYLQKPITSITIYSGRINKKRELVNKSQ